MYVERSEESIYVVNIYNAPAGCIRAGEAIASVIESNILTQKSTLWAGDFNLHHVDWDLQTVNPTPQARSLAKWVTNVGVADALPPGTITHKQGGTLDFVISSSSITPDVLECYSNPDLDTTSDHEVLSTTVALNGRSQAIPKETRFQFKKLDDKVFCSTLQAQTDIIQAELAIAQGTSKFSGDRKEKLDQYATKTLAAIYHSLTLSTPKICNSRQEEPWWNDQYRNAVQKLRNRRREDDLEKTIGIEKPPAGEQLKGLRNRLRKEVKQAKQKYYQ